MTGLRLPGWVIGTKYYVEVVANSSAAFVASSPSTQVSQVGDEPTRRSYRRNGQLRCLCRLDHSVLHAPGHRGGGSDLHHDRLHQYEHERGLRHQLELHVRVVPDRAALHAGVSRYHVLRRSDFQLLGGLRGVSSVDSSQSSGDGSGRGSGHPVPTTSTSRISHGAIVVTFSHSTGVAPRSYTVNGVPHAIHEHRLYHWTTYTSGAQFTGLVSGTSYWVEVTAMGPTGYVNSAPSVSTTSAKAK